jgi:hypothetical protein
MLCGCVGEVDDSCGNTTPTINKVVFYNCGYDVFNPDHECVFNVGDKFDVIIYATDCDMDMYTLYSSLGIYDLPEQVGVDRGYHFENCFIVDDVPIGFYIFKFEIEDRNGHRSNIVEIEIEVQ